MDPTTAPLNTHAPMLQQPHRPRGAAALPGLAPRAPETQTMMRRSLTPTASSCRQQRLQRLLGE